VGRGIVTVVSKSALPTWQVLRFQLQSNPGSTDFDIQAGVVSMSATPWASAELAASLELVESTARRHGYVAPRCSSAMPSQIDELERRLCFALPVDLRTFLLWHDPDLWSHFVNPGRSLVSDGNIMTTQGEMITPDHPQDRSMDIPRIEGPEDISGGQLVRDVFGVYANFFLSNMNELGRSTQWQNTHLVAFGSSGYFEPVIYCVDQTESPAGAIVSFTEDTEDRMWLADSLASWLARLAACDGQEYAFAPGSWKDLPDPTRSLYVREFRSHNPRSSFFGEA